MKPMSGMPTLPPSRMFHVKATGRRALTNARSMPAGSTRTSVLSRPSEMDVIDVTWHRNAEIELFPRVTWLDPEVAW